MAKKNQSNDNEKKTHGGRKTKQDNGGSVTVVLKIDMHCEGCAGKIAKAVRSLNGVESVKKGDNELEKITVIGNVDPVELRQKVEDKIKKKVELISPVIKSQNASPATVTVTATAVKDENKTKKFPVTTTVLKVSLHCRGCIDKIQKLVKKTDGFMEMSIDKSNDLVTVKGGMDVNQLMVALKDKLKRNVEIVPAKDGGGGGTGGKKGKGSGGDGDGGEGKGSGGDGGEGKESGGGGREVEGYNYKMEYFGGQRQYTYPQYVNGPGYTFNYMPATQMFNDENPNACVVM